MVMKTVMLMAVAAARMTRGHGPQEKPRALQLPHSDIKIRALIVDGYPSVHTSPSFHRKGGSSECGDVLVGPSGGGASRRGACAAWRD
jgi:hypothetical protein